LTQSFTCLMCATVHSFFGCTGCQMLVLLSEKDIGDLKSNSLVKCPLCPALLSWAHPPTITIEGTHVPSPGPWSGDQREVDFLARAAVRIHNADDLKFRTYHRTVGSRLLAAERHIDEIEEWRSPFIVEYDGSDSSRKRSLRDGPSEMDWDNSLFGATNTM